MSQFNIYQVIDSIRPRPAMYIGKQSLTLLRAFLDGCSYTAYLQGIECAEVPSFRGFHDWIAQRFGRSGSTCGWCYVILEQNGGDERKALDQFFELVEEYRKTDRPGAHAIEQRLAELRGQSREREWDRTNSRIHSGI